MRLFANAGIISRLLEKSFQDGEPLEHPLLNRSIGTAQKRVEGQNYTIRKRLLEYDDVINHQREIIYGVRNQALRDPNPRTLLFNLVADEITTRVAALFGDAEAHPDDATLEPLISWVRTTFPVRVELDEIRGLNMDAVRQKITEQVENLYKERDTFEDPEMLKSMERYIIITAVDKNWQDHLTEIEDLRRYVGLRGYAQKNPLNEYKNEAFSAFENMMGRVRSDVCTGLFRSATSQDAFDGLVRLIQRQAGLVETSGPEDAPATLTEEIQEAQQREAEAEAAPTPGITFRREYPKIGRNTPVRLRNMRTAETVDMKWKKAEPLLRTNDGWELEEVLEDK
jgi:preprotein translocase subunit SecA